jgi:hypothetical protein
MGGLVRRNMYVYTYTYVFVCMCVCVWVGGWGGGIYVYIPGESESHRFPGAEPRVCLYYLSLLLVFTTCLYYYLGRARVTDPEELNHIRVVEL